MKKVAAISVIAFAATALLYAGSLLSGRHWYGFLFLVPLATGALASGRLREPNELVSWVTTFFQFWILGLLSFGAAKLIMRRRGDS